NKNFNFKEYDIKVDSKEFNSIASDSGLINKNFTLHEFRSSFTINDQRIILLKKEKSEQLAQIIADFLRKKLLHLGKKFSFETVFSHPSKLQIMREAQEKGYKVYLYFVSTNSPEINKERVKLRVKEGGHNVPEEKIANRYYRSLELLFSAAQLTYQTFFFDNSKEQPELFTNFKVLKGKKNWKKIDQKDAPDWFIKYYAEKVKKINKNK
ncbi:MAG: zeta toxin family protein, partial [Bacteroidia bacterium]|nr:zeta toxin family protein [Bacteroidia bacterium]